jgi:4'-phosphopantetheinyl transferase EntD
LADSDDATQSSGRPAVIEQILPPEVACAATFGDDPAATLYADEAAQISGAVPSRLMEFATGRACARRALRKLDVPPMPILRGADRQPIWPSGVVGSITHCPGYRAAAVALQGGVLTLGIDAEVDEPLPAGVLEQVAVDEERDWLANAPAGMSWDRLLFSAKESVFKAWYPLAQRWLGFEDAVITFHPAERRFDARLLVTPPAALCSADLSGRFLVQDGLMLTAVFRSEARR